MIRAMPTVKRTVLVPACGGPGPCLRPAWNGGLCTAHYFQKRRAGILRPLRDPDAPAKVNVGIRVTPETKAAVHADPSAAREALERWASKQTNRKH